MMGGTNSVGFNSTRKCIIFIKVDILGHVITRVGLYRYGIPSDVRVAQCNMASLC